VTLPEPRTLPPTNAAVDVFVNKIVPFIEGKYHLQRPYVAMGDSMAGFNTATLLWAGPAMWSSCVLLNPKLLILTCDPLDVHVCGSKNPVATLGVKYLITKNFTLEDWRATQPFVLLQKTNMVPKTFVTACKEDDYGLFNCPKEWSDLAKSKNPDSEWKPVETNCTHYDWPAQDVLGFLPH
jgi:hypothetical protein